MTKQTKVLILTAALLAGVVGAARMDSEARALAVLKESTDYLSKAKSFRLDAELGFDVVQADAISARVKRRRISLLRSR